MTRYDVRSSHADEFINHQEILDTLAYAAMHRHDAALARSILEKARANLTPAHDHGTTLTHREASVLLACEDPEVNAEIRQLARDIKQAYYGNRIVLFAPLYLSNYCVNGCLYCPYHAKNRDIPRRKLTQEEIRAEVIALQDMGHKRLAIEAGEDPAHNPLNYILESLETIYGTKHKNGAIRRVNVNIAATTEDAYRQLKAAEIGTYILFQETYHRARYEELHPSGPKAGYAWHTEAHDRAMAAGIDDVGLGVLFGLEGYAYEFAGLLMHAEHLEAVFGVGPHTISVPRVKPASDIDPDDFDNGIPDEMFEKIIALIRIAVPYTRVSRGARSGAATGRLADLRRQPHQRGRLRGRGTPPRHRAVRRVRPAHPGRGHRLAHGRGPSSQLLHRVLSRRPHRRPLHGVLQERSDPGLLPAERPADVGRVPVRLRQPCRGGEGLEDDRRRARPRPRRPPPRPRHGLPRPHPHRRPRLPVLGGAPCP